MKGLGPQLQHDLSFLSNDKARTYADNLLY